MCVGGGGSVQSLNQLKYPSLSIIIFADHDQNALGGRMNALRVVFKWGQEVICTP